MTNRVFKLLSSLLEQLTLFYVVGPLEFFPHTIYVTLCTCKIELCQEKTVILPVEIVVRGIKIGPDKSFTLLPPLCPMMYDPNLWIENEYQTFPFRSYRKIEILIVEKIELIKKSDLFEYICTIETGCRTGEVHQSYFGIMYFGQPEYLELKLLRRAIWMYEKRWNAACLGILVQCINHQTDCFREEFHIVVHKQRESRAHTLPDTHIQRP